MSTWIAKPISRLTLDERESWQRFLSSQFENDLAPPLAQTLCWASGQLALGIPSYLIFNREKQAGGLVYANDHHLECTNGPLLHWNHFNQAREELAVFSQACTQLISDLDSIRLSPRWTEGQGTSPLLPIEPTETEHACTLLLTVEAEDNLQIQSWTDRLRRTLHRAQKTTPAFEWRPLQREDLPLLIPELREFGAKHGFFVPPENWFHALIQNPEPDLHFWLAQAMGEHLCCHLVVTWKTWAYFLYGFDSGFGPGQAHLSAWVHFQTLRALRALHVTQYDLGGFMEDPMPDHPYAGIAQFKAQFNGKLVRYYIPHLILIQ